MTTKQPTCAERVAEHWASRKAALEALWRRETQEHSSNCTSLGHEDDDLCDCWGEGELNEYGLSFDYVAPDAFTDQPEGYWRYQISTGGPGDELRFYASTPDSRCYRIEYWLLDWFDEAHIDITREEIASNLWDWFRDCGTTEHAQREALS